MKRCIYKNVRSVLVVLGWIFASTPKIITPIPSKRSTYHYIYIHKKIPICLCFDILIFCFTHFTLHPYDKKTRIIVKINAQISITSRRMCTLSKQKTHGIYVILYVTCPAYYLPVHPFFRLPVHHYSSLHVYPCYHFYVTLCFYSL